MTVARTSLPGFVGSAPYNIIVLGHANLVEPWYLFLQNSEYRSARLAISAEVVPPVKIDGVLGPHFSIDPAGIADDSILEAVKRVVEVEIFVFPSADRNPLPALLAATGPSCVEGAPLIASAIIRLQTLPAP
jgi:hypothetical protein